MPAIADQVATIEHDLAVAQTTVDSLRSENAQLKTALAALNVDHNALQAKHIDALALVDETRQHADGVASAALAMLKVSRRQIVVAPSEGTRALQAPTLDVNSPQFLAAQKEIAERVFEAIEPEKTDVRPELPEAEQGDTAHVLYETGDADAPDQIKDSNGEVVLGLCKKCGRAEIELSEPCGSPVIRNYRASDIVPLAHLGLTDAEIPNTDRLRAHMPANVLG